MDLLRATTIESNYPPLRRKNKSAVDYSFLKTVGESFLTFFQQSSQLKSRPSLKQSEQAIQQCYKKIHQIIDSVDQHLQRRLQNHELQMFSVVKTEIDQMRQQTRKIVLHLNQAIKQKNVEDQIWQLNNELDYFKNQTYKLFQQNKQVRAEMALLRKKIKEDQIEIENRDQLLQKMKRKEMKQLANTRKLSHHPRIYQEQHQNKEKRTKAHRTEASQEKEISRDIFVELPKQSIINIQLESKRQQKLHSPPLIAENQEVDPLADWSIPSEEGEKNKIGISTLPPARLIRVESTFSDEFHPRPLNSDKAVQTEQTQWQFPPAKQKDFSCNFSKTSVIQYSSALKLKQHKHIDFIKNGFQVKNFNKKSSNGHTPQPPSSSSHMQPSSNSNRYLSKALNRNKVLEESLGLRRSGIRTTMQ